MMEGPCRFRSATIYDGLIRSTTRSFLYGLGQDDDDIARPHLAVIHTGGEMSPCNTSLAGQAQHAKTGIYAGGGMPHECPVSDGLSIAHSGMRFSLISRELIADSVEAIVRGHQFDGIFVDATLAGLSDRSITLLTLQAQGTRRHAAARLYDDPRRRGGVPRAAPRSRSLIRYERTSSSLNSSGDRR
jgi:hypothetical protein